MHEREKDISTDTISVKLEELRPNPFQPESRIKVDEETARKYGESIYENGLLQMPVARKTANEFEIGDGWLRLCGYRWLVEQGHAEYNKLPVILHDYSDQQMADLVMETNRVRQDLNPIELAEFYSKYLEKFPRVTHVELARRQHKSQGKIANTIRLLELPAEVQRRIISREITESHGRVLLQLHDRTLMSEYAGLAVDAGLNVAHLDARIKALLASQMPQMEMPAQSETETEVQSEETTEEITEEETQKEIEESAEIADKMIDIPWITAESTSLIQPLIQTPVQVDEKPAGKPKSSTPVQPARPATPAAVPAPPKPNWGRKLVIEEKADHVLMSCMKAGGLPSFKKVDGTINDALNEVDEWLLNLATAWEKEGTK